MNNKAVHFSENRICKLFGIRYPVIQAGMIWCSGWELASAVSNAGGLGLIGSGSMYPEILKDQIRKCKSATTKPFGVNVPLLYPDIEKHIEIILEEKVPVVFSSAGNPKTWTSKLKSSGVIVVHVVSNVRFALKAVEAGVDAVVCEGFEAGGHNGREELTSMVLIPMVRSAVSIPLIAAGGIGTGAGMMAALSLGAEGVQIGSRFVASNESSAHQNFKEEVLSAGEDSTILALKALTPVRLLKNKFYQDVKHLEDTCAQASELQHLLGHGRAKKGMFEGDLEEGELEIGQIAGMIKMINPASEILDSIVSEYIALKEEIISGTGKY